MSESFFDEQSEQSDVKATLVAKYFVPYMRVMTSVQKHTGRGDRIAYIDLFAGPGRYKSGAKSTPVKILETAIADPEFRHRLVSIFNDKDSENAKSLETALKNVAGYDRLRFEPKIYCGEVGENIVQQFESIKLVPTLFFVDPWGYKGMSLRLLNSVLKDWGCDCFFFFNYSRINAGLMNDKVEKHLDALFGKERADKLRSRFEEEELQTWEREAFIIEEMCEAIQEMGGKFVLPFRFHNAHGTRVTHHLFFVTKDFRGYGIMKDIMQQHCTGKQDGKDIMQQHCTGKQDGVVNFEYNPADKRHPSLFGLLQGTDELEAMLLQEYGGKQMSVTEIYETHSVGKRFVLKDYKEVLSKMFREGKIQAERDFGKAIRPNTFPDDIRVTFKKAPDTNEVGDS